MSKLRTLTTTLAATAALSAGLGLATPAAYASEDSRLDSFNSAVDLSALQALVAATGGCTTTYEAQVVGTPIGKPTVVAPIGSVTVNYAPTLAYAVKIEGYTVAWIYCMV